VENQLNQIQVTMLLCDAAESVGSKLYILGGGWSIIRTPNTPINMALAVKLSVPWDQANRPIPVKATLYDEDRHDVIKIGDNELPVEAEGTIETGRPPGLRAGTSLDVPFTLPFPNIALDSGGYDWVLEVDGEIRANAPFRVL
jgi:hypothetical protein